MKQVETIEVATLKQQIDKEIDRGNYARADELTEKLCELQGLDTGSEMPEAFIFQLMQKEKERRKMSIKRNVSKAAIAILLIGISGGTAYAAVQQFKNVEPMEYGLTAGTFEEISYDENESFVGVSAPDLPEQEEDKIEVKDIEYGDGKQAWLTKEEREVEYSGGYESDDGIHWTPGKPYIGEETEYTYQDYSTACRDMELTDIFTASHEQNGNVVVTKSHLKYKDGTDYGLNDQLQLISDFKYNNGQFQVDESKELEWDGTEINMLVITGTEPAANQREYISAQGDTYQLSDDNATGVLRTTTLISYDEYNIIITFTHLSDQEIHEILDTISIKNRI